MSFIQVFMLKEISNMIPIDALKTPISVERVVKQISKKLLILHFLLRTSLFFWMMDFMFQVLVH